MNLVTSLPDVSKTKKNRHCLSQNQRRMFFWKDEHRDWIEMTVSSWISVSMWTPLDSLDYKLWWQGQSPLLNPKGKMNWLYTNHHFVLTTPMLSSISVEKYKLLVKINRCLTHGCQKNCEDMFAPVRWRLRMVALISQLQKCWLPMAHNWVGLWELSSTEEAPCSNLHPPLGVLTSKTGWWKSIKASPPPIGLNAGHFWRAIPWSNTPERTVGPLLNYIKLNFCLLPTPLPLPSLICWF